MAIENEVYGKVIDGVEVPPPKLWDKLWEDGRGGKMISIGVLLLLSDFFLFVYYPNPNIWMVIVYLSLLAAGLPLLFNGVKRFSRQRR